MDCCILRRKYSGVLSTPLSRSETKSGPRVGRENLLLHLFLIEWLRIKSEKNWLIVIVNIIGLILSRRLLSHFKNMKYGSLCDISMNKVTVRDLQLEQIIVEKLEPLTPPSLLLWKGHENNTAQEEDGNLSKLLCLVILDDLRLPTCKQLKAGLLVGQEPL